MYNSGIYGVEPLLGDLITVRSNALIMLLLVHYSLFPSLCIGALYCLLILW